MTENDIPMHDMEEEEMLREEDESVLDAFVRHQKKAAEEAKLAFDALLPEGFKVHSREAKRSFRKAFKVVLEELAERLEFPEEDEAEETPPQSTTGSTKVKVEVS